MIDLVSLAQGVAAVAGQVAQQVAATAAVPTDSASATLGSAVVIATILQRLKNSSLVPLISRETARLNFWISLLAAIATSTGLHWRYDVALGGTITLPPLHVAYQSLVQWAAQQGFYKGLVVPAETLGDIRGLLEKLLPPPTEAVEKPGVPHA